MICSYKRKRIEKVHQGVPIKKYLRAVQEAGYVLGHIGTNTYTTPRVKSQSFLKAKVEVIEMQARPNNYKIEEILADIPKGEKHQNPIENQYSVPCSSFGLGGCTKTLCVANKWWDIRPRNSDGTINQLSFHCSNQFKGLYDTKKIPHLVLNMEEKRLRIIYSHHILKHGENHYPYFHYDKNNWRSDSIKADDSVRK